MRNQLFFKVNQPFRCSLLVEGPTEYVGGEQRCRRFPKYATSQKKEERKGKAATREVHSRSKPPRPQRGAIFAARKLGSEREKEENNGVAAFQGLGNPLTFSPTPELFCIYTRLVCGTKLRLQWLQWLQWLHPPRGNREKKTRTDHRESNAKEAARPVTQVFLGTSIKMGFPAPRIPERPQYTRQVKGDHRPRYTCIVDSFINTNHHEKSYGYR